VGGFDIVPLTLLSFFLLLTIGGGIDLLFSISSSSSPSPPVKKSVSEPTIEVVGLSEFLVVASGLSLEQNFIKKTI